MLFDFLDIPVDLRDIVKNPEDLPDYLRSSSISRHNALGLLLLIIIKAVGRGPPWTCPG